jgi:hypothetical protein
VNGTAMYPPEGESEPRPATRSNRILGLLAAVGFSLAMWAFIAIAVIGLILKIVGPTDAEKGLTAAGNSVSQLFNLDSKPTETGPATGLTGDLGAAAGPITTLDGRPLAPAKPATPPETPAKHAPVTGPH